MTAVFVAVASVEWMWTQAAVAQQYLRLPPGSQFFHSRGRSSIASKRTALAEGFVQREAFSHLLFLDSDMTPPPDTVERLLSHNLPIVGALMFARVEPFWVCAGYGGVSSPPVNLSDVGGPDPLRQVDWCGTGCLLISREALLQVPKPWFVHQADAGHDVYFCRQAGSVGLPIHVDTATCVGHIGVTSVDLEHALVWQATPRGQRFCEGVGLQPVTVAD